MAAAAWNKTEMVRILLDTGANIEAANTVTAAFDHIWLDTSILLLVRNASINIYDGISMLQ